jgi:cytosine/adenosine deaminase-related metal-dependent hydrolase
MKIARALFALPVLLAVRLIPGCSDQENPPSGSPRDGGPGDEGFIDKDASNNPDGTGPQGPRGSCAVAKAGTSGAVVYQSTFLAPDTVVRDGEVMIDAGGLIACAAKSCSSTKGYGEATVVKCTDAVISPGLINPHDHITYANTGPQGHGTERYEHRHDWRKGIRGHTKLNAPGGAKTEVVSAAELRFLMTGVTTAASAGGADGLVRNVDGSPAQLEGLPIKVVDSQTFPLKDSGITTFPADCSGYSASRDKTTTVTPYDGYLPHISEGIGPEANLEYTCQDVDPYNLIQRQSAVIHGIAMKASNVAEYRTSQASLIWSPRSNVSLYGDTASVVLFDNSGVQIALGTDWLPSGSMNMARELKCADDLNKKYYGGHFTDKQLWQMVTINAAYAIGATTVVGQLKQGYVGDIAIFNAHDNKDYRAVIDASPEDTILVVRGGMPLFGDSALVADKAMGTKDCEDLDVCGVGKKVCIKSDVQGKDLATIKSAGEAVYPLFYCRGQTPKDEPSCVPYRDTYKSGATTGDKDGDGIPDASDNCKDVFNPVRPMDGGKQADEDGDGIGDACDRCPLDKDNKCTPPSADDIDGDGVANGVDNCPEVANADQADADKDGKGDVCDTCPTANPGAQRCTQPYTIPQLRDPSDPAHPAAGTTRALVSDVYVTAVRTTPSPTPLGFYIQAPASGNFQGMFVNTGTAPPTVKVGNKVTVEGDYDEVFSTSHLLRPNITVTDAGTTLPFGPMILDPADIAADPGGEPYEGMLCQINAVAVVTVNPDAPKDFDEFVVTGNLRVDDTLYTPLDNTYPVDTTFTKIIGICAFDFSNRKIWPRSAADITQ